MPKKKDHSKQEHEKQHGKLSDKILKELKEKEDEHVVEEDEVIHKDFEEGEMREEREEREE